MKKNGFTLIELLICLAILALLAAILLPAIIGAKKNASSIAAINNMRQTGMALVMYQDSNGDLPLGQAAYDAVPEPVLCDPMDYWRSNCSGQFGEPLLGSFGYVRYIEECNTFAKYQTCVETYPKMAWLSSIFHGDDKVRPFHGEIPDVRLSQCVIDRTCLVPNRLLQLRPDLSAKATKQPEFVLQPNSNVNPFSWAEVLLLH